MSGGEGDAGDSKGQVFFALGFMEVSIIYPILYERSLRLPSKAEIMDEIERRELYPKFRAFIPDSLDAVEDLVEDMREFLVAFATEEKVIHLENQVKAMVETMKGGKKT